MLYPFISVREEGEDTSVERVSCLPEKSLIDSRAATLERANYFYGSLFLMRIWCSVSTYILNREIQDFSQGCSSTLHIGITIVVKWIEMVFNWMEVAGRIVFDGGFGSF